MIYVLQADTPNGGRISMKMTHPPTDEERTRVEFYCALPAMAHATWTGREGEEVR